MHRGDWNARSHGAIHSRSCECCTIAPFCWRSQLDDVGKSAAKRTRAFQPGVEARRRMKKADWGPGFCQLRVVCPRWGNTASRQTVWERAACIAWHGHHVLGADKRTALSDSCMEELGEWSHSRERRLTGKLGLFNQNQTVCWTMRQPRKIPKLRLCQLEYRTRICARGNVRLLESRYCKQSVSFAQVVVWSSGERQEKFPRRRSAVHPCGQSKGALTVGRLGRVPFFGSFIIKPWQRQRIGVIWVCAGLSDVDASFDRIAESRNRRPGATIAMESEIIGYVANSG